MNIFLEKLIGFDVMTDQVIAMDLLIAAKSGVRNYAMAVTEAGSPEIKATLTRHLEEAIDMHERISAFMIERGWYHPWNEKEQFQLDLQNIRTALEVPVLG
ncbi:spore coat protein [Brevibacillus ruminantium]|uniref:Spore coat protein n=1 Tax=Brevibacillus ruminantium TaxID=2950604 RepID=A0ABY4WSA3_9BACL|nr:spore coat protein [Brevibacillus ruminantium]USG67466.1 spore coat protein [Brevibacillus ruminantium]